MHTVSKVIAENLKYYGWEGSEYPTLGELIRHPLLLGYLYYYDTNYEGNLLFWAEPSGANGVEDLYKSEEPEDTLGLALIDELQKANTKK